MRLPGPLHALNEGSAFALELVALVALGWWGFHTGGGAPVHVALGVGAPLAAAVVWGLFAAPKARFTVPLAGVLAVKALVFGAAAVALYALGWPVPAVLFAAAALANTALASVDRAAHMHEPRRG
ncbi:YrdB family protein [Actinomadura kijaniata]|uniref:YrdB family protein n=1 Tax=Actinomadura kijaniata TaxID=46161 RepID=UPI003F1BFE63